MTNESRRRVLNQVNIQPSTHIGLWLDRYVERLPKVPGVHDKIEELATDARTRAIGAVSNNRRRVAEGYREAFERRFLSLAMSDSGSHSSYGVFRSLGRVIVGMADGGVLENGIALERTWGVPVLPGSALKGVAAAAAHKLTEDPAWRKETRDTQLGESAEFLFGSVERRGLVTFHDAWWSPDSSVGWPVHPDILTVHNAPYYQEAGERVTKAPDGMTDPNPVSFLSASGSFLVLVSCNPEDEAWAEVAMQLLELGLQHLGVGAKTNTGYGRLEPEIETTEKYREFANAEENRSRLVRKPFPKLLEIALEATIASDASSQLWAGLRQLSKGEDIGSISALFHNDYQAIFEAHPHPTDCNDTLVQTHLNDLRCSHPSFLAPNRAEKIVKDLTPQKAYQLVRVHYVDRTDLDAELFPSLFDQSQEALRELIRDALRDRFYSDWSCGRGEGVHAGSAKLKEVAAALTADDHGGGDDAPPPGAGAVALPDHEAEAHARIDGAGQPKTVIKQEGERAMSKLDWSLDGLELLFRKASDCFGDRKAKKKDKKWLERLEKHIAMRYPDWTRP